MNRREALFAVPLLAFEIWNPPEAIGGCCRTRRIRLSSSCRCCSCVCQPIAETSISSRSNPPKEFAIIANRSGKEMVFGRCAGSVGQSYFEFTDFLGTTKIAHRMPHICEPATVPVKIPPDGNLTFDLKALNMNVSKVRFQWDGQPLIGPKDGLASPGKYYRNFVVTVMIEGSGLTYWVGRVAGDELPYTP